MQRPLLSTLILIAAACAAPSDAPREVGTLRCWGTLREVLRDGDARPRVRLRDVARPGTWGVGALAGLAGEVTIVDGEVVIAEARERAIELRPAGRRDAAALLVLARCESWTGREVPAARSADLGFVLDREARLAGYDPEAAPVPVRLEGSLDGLSLHVLAGACPLADPGGPPPARWSGVGASGTLVGVYAPGRAGELTHHTEPYHLHAVVEAADGRRVSGHVDAVDLGEGVRVLFPGREAPDGAASAAAPVPARASGT